jgi:prephenate dehydrogenase
MKALNETIIAIIGTGLMGSSLALALRGHVRAIHGVDNSPTHRLGAATYFDYIGDNLERAVAGADMVILAIPIQAILQVIEQIGSLLKPGALLLDLGSAKQMIVQAMDALPEHVQAVGGHPMCGKESSGPMAADAAMYRGAVFVLCETKRSTPQAINFVQCLIRVIGARPVAMSAERHDAAVAAISHLPYLLSVGLVNTVGQTAQDDPTPWTVASTGFRDTSRLASSNVTMMNDILMANREAILDALVLFDAQLHSLGEAIQSSDEGALRGILETARKTRDDWFKTWQTLRRDM